MVGIGGTPVWKALAMEGVDNIVQFQPLCTSVASAVLLVAYPQQYEEQDDDRN